MKRLGIISLFVLLFASFIWVWNFSYQSGLKDAYVPLENPGLVPEIPSETGVFDRFEHALDYANMPVDEAHQRTLSTYYENRAFNGAPPSIPHPVRDNLTIGDDTCLQCHANGGFTEKFNAYAPVAPHPEMVNCRQCHVAQLTQSVFKGSNFIRPGSPEVGVNNALSGSPPVIPHQIQMRENCLSCHAGPSAPREIRVTHPERINCRQCHVPTGHDDYFVAQFSRSLSDE